MDVDMQKQHELCANQRADYVHVPIDGHVQISLRWLQVVMASSKWPRSTGLRFRIS